MLDPISPVPVLYCPLRGQLSASALAADGLTPSEEARRIDFIRYLLQRDYDPKHIDVETVVLKNLGESGRNKLRCDVIVYSVPVSTLAGMPLESRLPKATLVAEIKRDGKKKATGIDCQLKPAMLQLPNLGVMGVYWDDAEQLLFVKQLVKKNGESHLEISVDVIANLPAFGVAYKEKKLTIDTLTVPDNFVAILLGIANAMRSRGVNDEHLRYKETVKLILARYIDERDAQAADDKMLKLQVFPGADPGFLARANELYRRSATRYSHAKTLFHPCEGSELAEDILRDIVKTVQGIRFSAASNETMQQVFMSFVPAVFKKDLSQYFTPHALIDTMVRMVRVGPNDKVADPAMGTADFLSAAMDYRIKQGDTDALQRVFGMDSDQKAFDLAVVNMILNRDGQSNLECGDSIQMHTRWNGTINVVLCNPPFGEKTQERRRSVLREYDFGWVWDYDENAHRWVKTSNPLDAQQLGILFVERCVKMLDINGRVAIILPEGYLCTESYGYVRQWVVENLQILSLVELPRGIFRKSDADLRSNILIARKCTPEALKTLRERNYPIHAEIVRKVGFKMGKGFTPIPARDPETGLELRDSDNNLILDSDFQRVQETFACYTSAFHWYEGAEAAMPGAEWSGARVSDILGHPKYDMKPRRLSAKALENVRRIKAGNHLRLEEIAEVVTTRIDILTTPEPAGGWYLIEGSDIRAIEGTVIPKFAERGWAIAQRKAKSVYRLQKRDIIVGLVRPERRNIGMLLEDSDDIVGSPDGIAVVRVKPEYADIYPQEWLFATLRSEACRVQLWTESGGTSYGKLTEAHIAGVLLPVPPEQEIGDVAQRVRAWGHSMRAGMDAWDTIGSDEDRRPIINSAIDGLDPSE